MKMMKAIYASDVKVGDFVKLHAESEPREVREVDCSPNSRQALIFLNGYGWQRIDAGSPVILLHRPCPEGKDEGQMRNAAVACAADFLSASSDENAIKLLETVEAHLLGRPLAVPAKEE